MSDENDLKQIDPILNLPVSSPATSLCFVSRSDDDATHKQDDGDSSNSDSSEELVFRSSRLQKESKNLSNHVDALSNQFLASCQQDGTLLLWDLARRNSVSRLTMDGRGMTVKRTQATNSLLYQTRDLYGTVSIVDTNQWKIIEQYETFSQTFCHAAPCIGDENLLALPSRQDKIVNVVDRRDKEPIYTMPIENHGMVTSIAMSVSGGSHRPIVACGMESGSVVFHHFGTTHCHASNRGVQKLSNDPVLALDIVASPNSSSAESASESSNVMVIAGLAGDAAEVSELSKPEQGRVALLKAIHDPSLKDDWDIQIRARLATCRVDEASFGKPGVSICKFRPDGRLFAIGGWDQRIRLFERSQGRPMAILRGHRGSVNSLDWSPDAATSGLLASAGGDDGRIYIWQCYGT